MRFYKPMLAKSISKPFSGKDWIFEIKWDGFRAIAYVDDYFTVQSRNAKELKHFFLNWKNLDSYRKMQTSKRYCYAKNLGL